MKNKYETNGQAGYPSRQTQPLMRRQLWWIVALLALELVNLTLWQLGEIPTTPSVFLSEIITCIASFLAGRIYEKFCK